MQQFAYDSRNGNRTTIEQQGTQTSNLFKLAVLAGIAYFVWGEKLNVQFSFGDLPAIEQSGKAVKTAFSDTEAPKARKPIGVQMPAGAMGNVTFAMDPGFAKRNGIPHTEVEKCEAAVRTYLKNYGKVAIAEMEKFGIPASITLAQGLLESNAGGSKLARSTNNHFGIKCFSRNCSKGHCMNFTDDSHKDFFRKYQNPWLSFRAHSQFLAQSQRYSPLFKLEKTDFVGWARGLSKAGYATDKKYGEKLIAIIHNLGLDKFDKVGA